MVAVILMPHGGSAIAGALALVRAVSHTRARGARHAGLRAAPGHARATGPGHP